MEMELNFKVDILLSYNFNFEFKVHIVTQHLYTCIPDFKRKVKTQR